MTRSRALTAVAVALLMTTISPMALAQDQCIGFEGNFWSGNCLVDPGKQYAKAYAMQNMMWKGKPHLAIDMGDEIQFFDLSNQNSPVSTGWTTFLMPLSVLAQTTYATPFRCTALA